MVNLIINGLNVSVEEGTTLLEAARFMGFPIPTLCHMDGLSPYGACRLCVVEIGEGDKAGLVSSCTYPAEEGLKIRTASARVIRARKMILELLLASCPQSKVIQDLAIKQTDAGATYLDVNVGTAAADQEATIQWLVEAIQETCSTSLCLDSQKPNVIAAGLKVINPDNGRLFAFSPDLEF